MVKYFLGQSKVHSFWDQVHPAPHREVTPDQKLLSWRLLTKTNRMPCWAERLFPANLAHSVYILEESIVDPQNQTVTTFTWNINHARLMVVEERCVYCVNSDNRTWVSSSLFGVSRAVQKFGLARFKSNVTKTKKGFEYNLAKLQGEAPSKTLVETAREAKEKAKETALAATEKVRDLANKASSSSSSSSLGTPPPLYLIIKNPALSAVWWWWVRSASAVCLLSSY
uniref:PRELI/MSF1 domain-containing protein n=1 Tax=Cricetulus griseus TaxID=10029 RepID=A0A8C2QHG0_CRIGR